MEDTKIYFKRKIYVTILKWKIECNGDTALLIQDARKRKFRLLGLRIRHRPKFCVTGNRIQL